MTGIGRSWLHPVTLILRDSLVLDRWRWVRAHLPRPHPGDRLLDAGCAAGAFTMGGALRGYDALGVDSDGPALAKAVRRTRWLGVLRVRFEPVDVRRLGEREDLRGVFAVVICCETIEHILDDAGLMRSLAGCLRPGGRLLLTAPNVRYRAITPEDDAAPSPVENGGHVRRGYAPEDWIRLCGLAGLRVVEVGGCGGFLSQKLTWLYRRTTRIHPALAAIIVLPFRWVPVLLDGPVSRALGWPAFSSTLVAERP